MSRLEKKVEKLEREIFSEENVKALEAFCENMKVVNQMLRKSKGVKKTVLLSKTDMAEMLNIAKLKDVKISSVDNFDSDIERDYLMSNVVNEGLAKIIKGLNKDCYYFNGTRVVTGWKSSNDSFMKLDGERFEIKGRSLIREIDSNIKYLVFKGETLSNRYQGMTWIAYHKNDTSEVLDDFENLISRYQLYKNKFITVHSGMSLSSSIDCKLNLNEIGLSPEVKEEAEKIIKMFVFSDNIKKNGLAFKRNILFHGEPGYGKTTVISAITKEVLNQGGTVFSFSLKNSTDSIDMLMQVIPVINNTYPSMLVLEDVDLIAKNRSDYSVLSNTILKMIEDNKKFIVLASTNNVKVLDGAFVRHGRMEKVFHISLDTRGKYKVFSNHLKYYGLDFNNWKEDKEVVKFLSKSNTSGAVINSALMCAKQDLVMSSDSNRDHKEFIKSSIKSLTWQNGNDEDNDKYIM